MLNRSGHSGRSGRGGRSALPLRCHGRTWISPIPVPRPAQWAVDWPDSPGLRVTWLPSTSGDQPQTRWTQKVCVRLPFLRQSAKPV